MRQAWGIFIGCSTLGSFTICVSEVPAKKKVKRQNNFHFDRISNAGNAKLYPPESYI